MNAKKLNKQQHNREQQVRERLAQLALTNPLIKDWEKLDSYYWEYGLNAELVAVIPALPIEDPKSQSYYASGDYSAAFLIENNCFEDYSTRPDDYSYKINPDKVCFLFDSEFSHLFRSEKRPHSQKSHYVKADNFDKYKAFLDKHPVAIMFKGCDDGHVGLRFESREKAMEFLASMEVFEDVFDYWKSYVKPADDAEIVFDSLELQSHN